MQFKKVIKKLNSRLHKLIIFASFPLILVGFIFLALCIMLNLLDSSNIFIRIYRREVSQDEIDLFFFDFLIYLKHLTLIFYILLLTWYLYFI